MPITDTGQIGPYTIVAYYHTGDSKIECSVWYYHKSSHKTSCRPKNHRALAHSRCDALVIMRLQPVLVMYSPHICARSRADGASITKALNNTSASVVVAIIAFKQGGGALAATCWRRWQQVHKLPLITIPKATSENMRRPVFTHHHWGFVLQQGWFDILSLTPGVLQCCKKDVPHGLHFQLGLDIHY